MEMRTGILSAPLRVLVWYTLVVGAASFRGTVQLSATQSVPQSAMLRDINIAQVQFIRGSSSHSGAMRLRGGKPRLLDDMREQLKASAEAVSEVAKLNETALDEFVESLQLHHLQNCGKVRFRLPLKFDSLEQEVNFYAIRGLLLFGQGWQQVASTMGRRVKDKDDKNVPHRDTAIHGLMQLHMEGNKLTADGVRDLKEYHSSQCFGIALTKEVPMSEGAPVTQDFPSDWKPYHSRIYKALVQMSSDLVSMGFKSLGEFCLSTQFQGHVKGANESGWSAELLTSRLAACFDSFKDEASVGSTTVKFHRKAQLLAEDLAVRFGHKDKRLNFTDTGKLTAGSDAETVMMLRRKGIIILNESLAERIARNKTIASGGAQEVGLRVMGALACTTIAKKVSEKFKENVTCMQVFRYIDIMCRDEYNAKVERLEESSFVRKDPEEKIEEIKEEKPNISLNWGPDIPLHLTKDTSHY